MYSHEKIKAAEQSSMIIPVLVSTVYRIPGVTDLQSTLDPSSRRFSLNAGAYIQFFCDFTRPCFPVDREGLRSRQYDGGEPTGEKARSASRYGMIESSESVLIEPCRNELTPSVSTCEAVPFATRRFSYIHGRFLSNLSTTVYRVARKKHWTNTGA